jgi:trehalose 6-phosphate synthase/phosphatase
LLNVLIVGTNITDVEFGRVQARDMLQHLWTGPISNAAVDVVQGSKSVEVRPVGVSKVILYLNIYTEKEQCRMWAMEITENMIDGHSDLLMALANLTRS